MDPVSPVPALASTCLALLTAFLLHRRFGLTSEHGRYQSIDGLRGYLALFVFFHHASIWYFFLRTGRWNAPPSHLYTHFGQGSVAIFFMITGFLFFSKLIDGRSRPIDWGHLFVSRFLRLVPLYLLAMAALFLTVAFMSHALLNEPWPSLLANGLRWLGFTIFGAPNLNALAFTGVITAGVTWSLPYEWLFYFSLPLLAVAVGVMPPWQYALLSLAGVPLIARFQPEAVHLMSFLGGIAAAGLVRVDLAGRYARHPAASCLVLACLLGNVSLFPSAYGTAPHLLLCLAFALIACGNSLFGTLTHPVSRMLGEMAYSLYLLHGLVLFWVFDRLLGHATSSMLSSQAHWLTVIGLTPVLVGLCFVTFRYIEYPAMQRSRPLTAWLRSRATAWRRGLLRAGWRSPSG